MRPSVIASPVAMRVALLGRCGLREPNATGASDRSLEDFLGDEEQQSCRKRIAASKEEMASCVTRSGEAVGGALVVRVPL